MQRDDDSDRYEYEHDRPLIEFMEAVETVSHFIGGDEGERVRKALLVLGHVPEQPPPEQHRFNFPESAPQIPY